ncbi:hypothetical protein UA08_04975 [Talaromyces atroroseus]|uniref:AB hydrolase-1 domain-containing protein n=1 Tax=Talaromyces atroroseus TaxID=1441469 RepID=A0A225AKW0_TALAT|nr:hypothetical protein UA08_04975 [Talaromyces atroroseus]OKL60043.1 hypothetical protein UA08_04975 [Talaromyces atroroseus]
MVEASKPVIMLVPGMLLRAAHYRKVVELLRQQGYEVFILALATSADADINTALDMTDDHRALQEVLLPVLDQGKKVVIVAHSYGNLPASTAVIGHSTAERSARGLKGGVEALITVAGYAFPARGKSFMNDDNDPPIASWITVSDGILQLKDSSKSIMFNDLTDHEANEAWLLLFKQQTWKSMCAFPEYITADVTVPKTYVICEKDQIIPAPYQDVIVQYGKYDHVVRLPSGHIPFLSVPDKVLEVIVEVAAKI